MRHRRATAKLGMKSAHRRATLANLVGSLIQHHRITTTLARAKEARRWADKMVTLAKKGTLAHRRRAVAFLRHKPTVKKLFAEIGPRHADRAGGYTRIIHVGQRRGDAARMAILEWTGVVIEVAPPETESGPKGKAKETAKGEAGEKGQPGK